MASCKQHILSTVFLFSMSLCSALTWTDQVPVNTNAYTDSFSDAQPDITYVGPGKAYATWQGNGISFAQSSDNGQTWSDPVKLADQDQNASTASDWLPVIAADDSGSAIVAWGRSRQPVYSRSTDGGATWSEPKMFDAPTSSGAERLSIVTDGKGTWIVMMSNRPNPGMRYYRSTDAGATWSPAATVTVGELKGGSADVKVSSSGTWLAIWSLSNPDNDLYVARSTDAGVAWSTPQLLHPDDTSNDALPTIATDNKGLWTVAWKHDSGISSCRSTDDGLTWSQPVGVTSTSQSEPSLVCDNEGKQLLVWDYAFAVDNFQVYYATASGTGAWSRPVLLETRPPDYPGVSGQVDAATDRNGNWMVCYYMYHLVPYTTPGQNLDSDIYCQTTGFVMPSVAADMSIEKTAGVDDYAAGDPISYLIKVKNNGPGVAEGVLVRDALTSGLVNIETIAPGGNVEWLGNMLHVQYEALEPGAVREIVLKCKLPGTDRVVNRASVSAATTDTLMKNNVSECVVQLRPSSDVRVTKGCNVETAAVDQVIYYELRAYNNGPSLATNVVLTDVLPDQLQFVKATESTPTVSGKTLTFSLGNINPGMSRVVKISARVKQAGTVTNVAEIQSSGPDPIPANNRAVSTITALPLSNVADLSLVKTVSAASIAARTHFTFNLAVKNAGPLTATDVRILDRMPLSVGVYSASQGVMTREGEWITISLGNLEPGQSKNIVLDVAGSTAGVYENLAQVIAAVHDNNLYNNTSVVKFEITAAAPLSCDLHLDKSVSADNVLVGDVFSYDLSVTNNGRNAAVAVTIVDTLPEAMSLTGVDGAVLSIIQGKLLLNVGSVEPGATKNVRLSVVAVKPGTYMNYARVISFTADSDLTNNEASVPVTIDEQDGGGGDDVSGIDLTGQWDSVKLTAKKRGAKTVYQVKAGFTARNIGDADAGNSKVVFYLSSDSSLDGGDRKLKQIAVGKLVPDQARGKNLAAALGQDGPGKYLIAVVELTDGSSDVKPENNIVVFGPMQ